MTSFIGALAAGVAVALGGYAYIACESRYLGGFLFSFGMFAVCLFSLPLYTGRIAYALEDRAKMKRIPAMLLGNILGAVLVGLMSSPVQGGGDVLSLVKDKLAQGLFQSFLGAVLCGAVIFIIVDSFKRNPDAAGRWLGILLGVPVFVISRFENSIPDVFYFAAAFRQFAFFEPSSLLFILAVLAGNGIGAAGMKALVKYGGEQAAR